MAYHSDIPSILAQARARAELVVEKTTLDIVAGSRARTPPRVDTGTMINGWAARPHGDLEWEAYNPVEYSKFNEHGTRHMAPHPMIVPAAEAARPGFEQAMGQVFQ